VLVTGAAGGLGRALAAGFASHGATLVLADLDRDALQDAARAAGAGEWHVYDQADAESVERLAAASDPVDVLVNNAGILLFKPLLDCIASGALWVDMKALGVDVLVSAPQKGWTGSPGCAFVMLSEAARAAIDGTTSSSYACDLKKWLQIMETYENGGHAYHTTLPTDALTRTRDVMLETRAGGFDKLRHAQQELGNRVRALLERHGIKSVAAPGFKAPGVVVSYTDDDGFANAKTFIALGLQTAAGVPLQCDEGADFKAFRIGLFGLEKLHHVERTVANLEQALTKALAARGQAARKAA